MINIENIAKYFFIGIVIFLVCFIIYVIAKSANTIPEVIETHTPTINEIEVIRNYLQ